LAYADDEVGRQSICVKQLATGGEALDIEPGIEILGEVSLCRRCASAAPSLRA
jgi:hypothetical protein